MIKRKKGKCEDCPQDKPEQWLVKNKPPLCGYHNDRRKTLKKIGAGKTPYKYVRKATGELDIFRELAEEKGSRSEISGEPIARLTPSNFIHVLAKGQGKFPLFKTYKKNIVIGTAAEHTAYDQGNVAELMANPMWDSFFKLRDELLDEYKELEKKLKIGNYGKSKMG